eukprot:Blabericola_migrator_1__3273@NODE_1963_length_3492_cov_8_035328_g1131_i1_p2_GENE_NODE_1963_length_3492_cov_8_035328_g1131_i1NODE_1963_length_3492_cov_8_035328_g1131_i1_p2_ORF_typecomplete_len124_score0_72Pyr_excise/PF03013_14/0_042_NODE_1963_length_3492_cov_8_035328_g1131_i111791550
MMEATSGFCLCWEGYSECTTSHVFAPFYVRRGGKIPHRNRTHSTYSPLVFLMACSPSCSLPKVVWRMRRWYRELCYLSLQHLLSSHPEYSRLMSAAESDPYHIGGYRSDCTGKCLNAAQSFVV